jgi:cytochrome c553
LRLTANIIWRVSAAPAWVNPVHAHLCRCDPNGLATRREILILAAFEDFSTVGRRGFMNKFVVAGLGVLCFAPVALPMLFATNDAFPNWAYPVDPPPTSTRAQQPNDEGALLHVPDSDVALTRTQIEDGESAPDWHPNDHPPMPDIVKNGRPNVRACAYCHQPSGVGRPENASLAGLPENYIKEQIDTFKKGLRKGSEPKRVAENVMNQIAANLTEDEIAEAAHYFSALQLGSFVKVVETDTVPKTFVTDGMLAKSPEAGTEPIGQRIIEVPEDLARAKNRDPRTPFVAYVPKGSLQGGKPFVIGGALPCISCHGPDLHGRGDVPHIAGRSPSYILRQLYDIQKSNRAGAVAPMQQVVAGLKLNDMIAIAAYVASRDP